jgi:hypothetical protein
VSPGQCRCVGERQVLDIGLDPLRIDTPLSCDSPAGVEQLGGEVGGDDRGAVAAAGIAALPDPAATSSTRWPARTPDASTSVGPSVGMRSVATAG